MKREIVANTSKTVLADDVRNDDIVCLVITFKTHVSVLTPVRLYNSGVHNWVWHSPGYPSSSDGEPRGKNSLRELIKGGIKMEQYQYFKFDNVKEMYAFMAQEVK